MSVPTDSGDSNTGMDNQPTVTSNWAIDVSDARTIKVSNISLRASEQVIKEFFSFAGDIQYVEMQRETDISQLAYITFKESQGADRAMLLTGSVIVDLCVNITLAENYKLPPAAIAQLKKENETSNTRGSAVQKAEEVVSSMLAKGYVLGKDALAKAKSFDERLHLTSNAAATVMSLDQKIGLSEKLSMGSTVVNEKMREMDERFQFSEKTKSVINVAETAGSVIMSNWYVSTSAAWVSSALNMVAKAAEDVSVMMKEKVEKAEKEKKECINKENIGLIHIDKPADESPMLPVSTADIGKLGII